MEQDLAGQDEQRHRKQRERVDALVHRLRDVGQRQSLAQRVDGPDRAERRDDRSACEHEEKEKSDDQSHHAPAS